MEKHTGFLDLWQQHKISMTLTTTFSGFESLHVSAAMNRDSTPENEVEDLLHFFNQLAGTAYTLATIKKEKDIEHVERGNMLHITEKTLWLLDMGRRVFPIYEVSEEGAEYIARVVENTLQRQRHSLTLYPEGIGEYPGSLLIIAYNAERLNNPTMLLVKGGR